MTSPTTLVKGQNAPLPGPAARITVDVPAPTDLSALLVTEAGTVRTDADFVFFNQPTGPGVRCTRDGDSWRLDVDLAGVPADIDAVRAVVNLETPGQRFGQLVPPVATVADGSGSPLVRYEVTGLDSEMIMVAVELYRRGDGWKVRAVGQGYAGGLADLISDHGVTVDDPGNGSGASATPPAAAPPAPAAEPPAPDTGGAFGHLRPTTAPANPATPTAASSASPPDTGGAFGHLQPEPPPASQPPPAVPQQQPASAPPPPPPADGFPPPPQTPPAAGYPPPQTPPAAGYPPPQTPPAAGYPPPQGPAAGYPPPGAPEPGLSASRPVSLQKGQQVSLRKDTGGDLTVVRMGLGWDPIKRRGMFGSREIDIDLDASVVLFADQQVVDVVFYNSLRSKDGSIQHTGDNRTGMGEGDDETVVIDLTRVATHVNALMLIVTSYEGQTFEQVQNAFCRLIDDPTGSELARYTLAGGMPFTGMVMAKLARAGSGWTMRAIGEGIQARTPSQAFDQLPRYL